MQAIETIRRNIAIAEDLRDIVKTMRTLSAVSIHHFEKAVESTGDYYRSVEMGIQVVLSGESLEALERQALKAAEAEAKKGPVRSPMRPQ